MFSSLVDECVIHVCSGDTDTRRQGAAFAVKSTAGRSISPGETVVAAPESEPVVALFRLPRAWSRAALRALGFSVIGASERQAWSSRERGKVGRLPMGE